MEFGAGIEFNTGDAVNGQGCHYINANTHNIAESQLLAKWIKLKTVKSFLKQDVYFLAILW